MNQINLNRDMVALFVSLCEMAQDYASAVTAFKRNLLNGSPANGLGAVPIPPSTPSLPAGAMAGIRKYTLSIAAQLDAHPAMHDGTRKALGIFSSTPERKTPDLRLAADGSERVVVSIRKAGYRVLAIDSRPYNGEWQPLAVATNTPFLDTRPLAVPGVPEVREYRVQGMLRNARVGPLSATRSVLVQP